MVERSHKGLVLRDVTVKRGGKTFTQKRWVKAGEDEPEPKKGKGVDEKISLDIFTVGDEISMIGEALTIEKIDVNEKTIKMSDGKVYTLKATKLYSKPLPKIKYKVNDKIIFNDEEKTIIKINRGLGLVELDDGKMHTFDDIETFSKKSKKDPKIKDLKPIETKPEKKIKKTKINTKKLSKQMESHVNDVKKEIGGEELLDGILQYTGGDYKLFNEYLRSGKMSIRDYSGKVSLRKPTKTKEKEMNESMNIVSDFLENAPKMEGTVYRGMVWGNDKKSLKNFDDFLNNVNNNNNIKFPNFSSTSTSKETATDFATSQKGVKSVIIEMKSKSGVYLNGTSAFEDENEVLFDKNSNFKIIKVDQESKPHRIYLEEI